MDETENDVDLDGIEAFAALDAAPLMTKSEEAEASYPSRRRT
jgi:hypothetical protein